MWDGLRRLWWLPGRRQLVGPDTLGPDAMRLDARDAPGTASSRLNAANNRNISSFFCMALLPLGRFGSPETTGPRSWPEGLAALVRIMPGSGDCGLSSIAQPEAKRNKQHARRLGARRRADVDGRVVRSGAPFIPELSRKCPYGEASGSMRSLPIIIAYSAGWCKGVAPGFRAAASMRTKHPQTRGSGRI